MHIIQMNSREAKNLLSELKLADSEGRSGLWSLRVTVEGDQVKFKVNEWTWSIGMGRLDPMCEEAQRRKAFRDQMDDQDSPIVQDDERAKQFTCPTCQSRPGVKCTEATETGRKKVAYIHTSRINVLRDVLES